MSHAPQEAIKKVMKNEEDFYKLMHLSDLAYAVTRLVNNEEKWRAEYEKDKKKKQTEEAEEAKDAEDAEAEVAQSGRGGREEESRLWKDCQQEKRLAKRRHDELWQLHT